VSSHLVLLETPVFLPHSIPLLPLVASLPELRSCQFAAVSSPLSLSGNPLVLLVSHLLLNPLNSRRYEAILLG
jgi:hypothetical protein